MHGLWLACLVGLLGHDDVTVRRAAQAGIRTAILAGASREAPRVGCTSRDPEVRRRCRLLLDEVGRYSREERRRNALLNYNESDPASVAEVLRDD